MKKFIIDTDIGDDIDDAFALDLALKKGLDVECVTTVFRNTRQRAAIAKKMLAFRGVNIPVYAGFGRTWDGRDESPRLCQWTPDLDDGLYAPDNAAPEEAAAAIVAAAKKYGKNFRVLAIGPLTNVATAIRMDPDAMKASGGIVMMGGDYVNHYAEWNICCDVAAAEYVFSSGISIVAFGHEITSQAKLSPAQQARVLSMNGDAYHAYLAELSRLWYASKPAGWAMVLHDVLVARYAAEPDFCKTASAPVEVETRGRYTTGMTVNLTKMDLLSPRSEHIVAYASEVDIPEFIGYFMKTIGCGAEGGMDNHDKICKENGGLMLGGRVGVGYDGVR